MAEKDITEKVLMSHADVFADCINALIYHGKQRLNPENTQPAPTESFYHGQKPYHQFCDVSRYLIENGNIIAQYIIENETQPRERQILRKMSYQGGAYRQQLENKSPVYAVVGIVMAWTGKTNRIPLSLHKLLAQNGIPPEETALTDDTNLTIFRMNNLSSEVRKCFVSDMGFVVDYLNEGNFENRRGQKIIHVEALCEMMKSLTDDTRFTDLVTELLEKQKEGREIIMCEYIDMLEARGEARGIAIGEARGLSIGEARGLSIGEARGESKGENRLARLIQILLKENKYKEIEAVSGNQIKRHELYRQYGI